MRALPLNVVTEMLCRADEICRKPTKLSPVSLLRSHPKDDDRKYGRLNKLIDEDLDRRRR